MKKTGIVAFVSLLLCAALWLSTQQVAVPVAVAQNVDIDTSQPPVVVNSSDNLGTLTVHDGRIIIIRTGSASGLMYYSASSSATVDDVDVINGPGGVGRYLRLAGGSGAAALVDVANKVADVTALLATSPSDNQLYQTLGYSTEGVGANLYRYDSASEATIDGGFVLPGPGGTLSFSGTTFDGDVGDGGRFIAVDQTVADVTKFGATTGVDCSNAVLRACSTSDSVTLPPLRFLLTSSMSLSSIDDLTITGFGATIYETSGALTSMLSFTSCDRLRIVGLDFESAEDTTYFAANTPTEVRAAISLTTCEQARIENVSGTAKRRFIYALSSPETQITGVRYKGFMPLLSSGAVANANECPCITLRGCNDSSVTDANVTYHGSAVLVQLTSERVRITGVAGSELHDNGVYLSSAKNSSVSDCSFLNIHGDGVQARGLNISVTGCHAENAAACVSASGINPADAFGAGGSGISIVGCTSIDCERVAYVTGAYNLSLRDVSVIGCSAQGSTITGATAPIEILTNVGGVTCVGNTVATAASDMGIVVAHPGAVAFSGWTADDGADTLTKSSHGLYDGTQVEISSTGSVPSGLSTSTTYYVISATTDTIQLAATYGGAAIDLTDAGSGTISITTRYTMSGVNVSNNVVKDVNGSGASTRGGIRVYLASDVVANGNQFSDIASNIGVRLLTVTGGVASGNLFTGGGAVRVPTGESNTNVTIVGNRGASVVADGDNNTILQNDASVTGYPATSTTPRTIGQTTFSGGAGYIATGVSSSADWKQITP